VAHTERDKLTKICVDTGIEMSKNKNKRLLVEHVDKRKENEVSKHKKYRSRGTRHARILQAYQQKSFA